MAQRMQFHLANGKVLDVQVEAVIQALIEEMDAQDRGKVLRRAEELQDEKDKGLSAISKGIITTVH